jgi:hypothetical protein
MLLRFAQYSEWIALVLLVGLSIGTYALTGSIWLLLLVFFVLPAVIVSVPVMRARRQG